MLTPHQEEKVDKGVSLLLDQGVLLVKGSAGTGKTYCADSIIDRALSFLSPDTQVLCTAPTNKAVAVLRGKITQREYQRIATTHRALKLRMQTNEETGEEEFVPGYDSEPLAGKGILLIDEASMVSKALRVYVEQCVIAQGWYLIYLGDAKQLPPVKEKEATVFTQGYPEVELTEPRRNAAENPILELSMNLGLLKSRKSKLLLDGTGYVHTALFPSHVDTGKRIIEKLAEVNGTNELKYLAFSNAVVDSINLQVRELLYTNPSRIELGETLVMQRPYGDYYTSEEVTVDTLELISILVPFRTDRKKEPTTISFNCYLINGPLSSTLAMLVLHESSDHDFAKRVTEVNKAAKERKITYREANLFKSAFARVTYAHALTVHKSQGSTYKSVILNARDIRRYTRRNKKLQNSLFYTGITRAAELLLLHGT